MMSQQVFSRAAGAVFLLVALLHALRLIFHWEAILDGRALPMWMSWVAVVVTGYLSVQGFRLSQRGHGQRTEDGRGGMQRFRQHRSE